MDEIAPGTVGTMMMLTDGTVMVQGYPYNYSGTPLTGNVTNTGEIYDPLSNTSAPIANHPEANFVDDIDHAVNQIHVEFDSGVFPHEPRPKRCEIQNAEAHGRIDAQPSMPYPNHSQKLNDRTTFYAFPQSELNPILALTANAQGTGQRRPTGEGKCNA